MNELNALNGHIDMLEGQNRTMNKELETIVNQDERVRSQLDRRNRVETMKAQNDS